MSEWRSRPPERAKGLERTWYGSLVYTGDDYVQARPCHNGSHRTAEAALRCTRQRVKRLNRLEEARANRE